MSISNELITKETKQIVLSNPRKKDDIIRVKIRPILLRDVLHFQFESFTKTQVFHENKTEVEAMKHLDALFHEFRQVNAWTQTTEYQIVISKKGKQNIQKRELQSKNSANGTCGDTTNANSTNDNITNGNITNGNASCQEQNHNRQKNYLLPIGTPVPFLQDLGVMTADGKIVRNQYDKFRQINRFLEFIDDILPELMNAAQGENPKETNSKDANPLVKNPLATNPKNEYQRELRIVDFGSGKSYLTFAMYYYLVIQKGLKIQMIGLDLKESVINHCNDLAKKYQYDSLQFIVGDIADYEGVSQVDMVVTLHACDTATDYALVKAVAWNAKVILSVPCCQHEVNRQLSHSPLMKEVGAFTPLLKYGLLKERFASLLTDGLRAEYLEQSGYKTQVLEFIDLDHTPKNILIRGIREKSKRNKKDAIDSINATNRFFHIHTTLMELEEENA